MTAATVERPASTRRPVQWPWLAFSIFMAGLAIMLGIMTSGECYRGDGSVAFAGGPIGWVAISALVSQSVWAGVKAFRPASS